MTTLTALNERIYRLNDDFNLFSAKSYPATDAELARYAAQNGQVLPVEFVQFLTHWGAMILEVDERIWPRPELHAVVPYWHFGYGFFVFGLTPHPEQPDWLNYDYEENQNVHGQCFFEITGGGDRAYLRDGEIYIVVDDMTDETGEKYPGNLFSFLIDQIDRLERDYHEMVKAQGL